MLKDKPILFNTEMVKAILNGNKTQTRRIIKPHPIQPEKGSYFDSFAGGPQWNWWSKDHRQYLGQIIKCPYEIGQKLWIRETWFDEFKALYPQRKTKRIFHYKASVLDKSVFKWKPSIFMPKEACRLWLEITNIRAEKLQNITPEDIIHEGCTIPRVTAKTCFRGDWIKLWNSINEKRGYSWESNPWVWVIEFKKIKP